MKGLNVVLAMMGFSSVFTILSVSFVQKYNVGLFEKGFTLFMGGALFGMTVYYIIICIFNKRTDNGWVARRRNKSE